MHIPLVAQATFAVSVLTANAPRNLVLTNDDGWATAQIRAQFDALTDVGYEVVLSAPALNQSGTGSRSRTPTVLERPCEFNTCPVGSPAEGFNASDPRFNYVNAYPVDAARYGIRTLSPQFFGGFGPDFLVSGPNIGLNVGIATQFSGTVGAAAEASKLDVPAVAFSGASGAHVSYATLESNPDSLSTLAARTYSALTTHFVDTLLSTASGSSPLLLPGTVVSVNYPPVARCPDPGDYTWVLARNLWNPLVTDVQTCGSAHLPSEGDVVASEGCHASVAVLSASTKTDVDAATQAAVMEKLVGLPLSCLD